MRVRAAAPVTLPLISIARAIAKLLLFCITVIDRLALGITGNMDT